MSTITNAKILPKVYYGLHFCEGVAEYNENGKPYRIFLNEQTIKNMDASYAGRPVYVHHIDDVDLDKIQTEADGYVIESFYNRLDGKHWAKFIVVSDKGHDAVRNGWKLSNAYLPKRSTGGGQWHGVDYVKEVIEAEYEHLAIVPNPRYSESVIMTPEEFKVYNSEKENELSRIQNSKDKEETKTMKLNFWKKDKVENSSDLENMSVELPKSKREITITKLVNEFEEMIEKKEDGCHANEYANGDHKVKVGDEEMTVNELIAKHLEMKNTPKIEVEIEPTEEEKKANEEKAAREAEEKKANDEKLEKEIEEKKQNALKILNAENANPKAEVVETSDQRIARGNERYGSGK